MSYKIDADDFLEDMVKEALKAFAFLTKPLKHTRDSPTDSWRNYFELEMLDILF